MRPRLRRCGGLGELREGRAKASLWGDLGELGSFLFWPSLVWSLKAEAPEAWTSVSVLARVTPSLLLSLLASTLFHIFPEPDFFKLLLPIKCVSSSKLLKSSGQ